MEKYINEWGKECWSGCTSDTKFDPDDFYQVDSQCDDHCQFAMHTNLGSLTVLDRMTGFGWRDIETGYRDPDGKFWLASGNFDIRDSEAKTIGEAINLVKRFANTCNPSEGQE